MDPEDINSIIKSYTLEDLDVASQPSLSGKAYKIFQKYGIPREQLCSYFGISNSSITRAKHADDQGFDLGMNGRHQFLSNKDEHILERWLQFLIDLSVTVQTSTLMELVCFVFFFVLLFFLGK